MKYLDDVLGIETRAEPWGGAAGLPYYLTDRYEFKKAVLEGVECLFLMPIGELETLGALKKHIAQLHEIEPLPIVLELEGITARRRKSLIGARIPFVAQGSQIYLPFLGIALTERYTTRTRPADTLMPSSQLLLFHYLYQNEPEMYASGIADRLNLSVMQVSRAARQLEALGLVSLRKDGVRMVMSGMGGGRRDLFEMAKPHLLNPVRKRVYADFGSVPGGLPLSGLSALSELTMLNPPAAKTLAFFGSADALAGADTLIDSDAQAEVEVWRYAPALLSDCPGMVDALSLIASIQPAGDERVEQAIEGLLSVVWR